MVTVHTEVANETVAGMHGTVSSLDLSIAGKGQFAFVSVTKAVLADGH